MVLRAKIEQLLEEKRGKNEERRQNRITKEMTLEMLKNSVRQLRGDAPQLSEGPIAMYNKNSTRPLKSTTEYASKTQTHTHAHPKRVGHFITHPCPCAENSGIPCPLHMRGSAGEADISGLEEAIRLINSNNEKDKMRGLRWIINYAEDNSHIMDLIVDEFGDGSMQTIVRTSDWEAILTRLLTETREEEKMQATPEVMMEKEPGLNADTIPEDQLPELEVEYSKAEPPKPTVSTTGILAVVLQKAFMDSIKKIVESKQAEDIEEFKKMEENGKASWSKTHFIFILDCSGSMKGTRWDAVRIGYDTCLKKIQYMSNVFVSAFSFDIKVNPFCKEKIPAVAIANSVNIPFTGKGTNYKRALEYAINIMKQTKRKDYLTCIMFLSDGLGGYPDEGVNEIIQMKDAGRKVIFYTIACETDEEEDMIKLATELGGEHYKVTTAEASRIVFSAILSV
jgi:Mg-chelatase subunit ChlD